MSKRLITIENNYNFELIGIISSQKDYTLAWQLNEMLGLKFSKVDEEFSLQKFSFFKSNINNKLLILIENKTSESCFLPELKKFDFVLKIFDIEHFNSNIKSKIVSTNDCFFSGILEKSKLRKKTLKIISEIEI